MIIQNNILRQKKGKNVASMRIPILFGTKKDDKQISLKTELNIFFYFT